VATFPHKSLNNRELGYQHTFSRSLGGPIKGWEVFQKTKHSCEVLGFGNGTDGIFILLRCDFASLGD